MLDAARTVLSIVENLSEAEFLADRKLQMAVERGVEIIGEAVRNLSEEFKHNHPEIPWHSWIGQRNVLAHQYGEIQQDRIWGLAMNRIPELIAKIERLVSLLDGELG